MEPKDITALAIKFFGIYLLVNIFIYAPSIITMMTALERYSEEDFNSGIYVIVVGSFMLVGVLVSLFLFRLSNSILSSIEGRETDKININQEFLLQVLGVYFIIRQYRLYLALVVLTLIQSLRVMLGYITV